jgi:uncharacterized protein
MVINVAQISADEGLEIKHLYPEGGLKLENADARVIGPVSLKGHASRSDSRVEISGRVDARVEYDCDRCLRAIELAIKQPFDLAYVPPLGAAGERILGEDDLDVGFYRGEVLDLDDVAREQIELALPMSKRCSEDCKGLCPVCGANLNEAACACREQEIDPRWAALKSLKTDN